MHMAKVGFRAPAGGLGVMCQSVRRTLGFFFHPRLQVAAEERQRGNGLTEREEGGGTKGEDEGRTSWW